MNVNSVTKVIHRLEDVLILSKHKLIYKINNKTAVIGIIGLGYVGLHLY